MSQKKIVLKYLGDGSQSWSCVPPRDLTQADLDYIEEISHDKLTILEYARFPTGAPLYREVKSKKQEVKDNGNDTE